MSRPPDRPLPLTGLALVAVTVAVCGQLALQATFATVGHPVSLGTANTTADATTVRGWYQVLITQGTLDRMVATELVDFIWVAGTMSSVVLLTLLAAALLRHRNPRAARTLRRLAPWTAAAPGLDAVENLLSLTMLADPAGFPGFLAVAHAVVSWLKLVAMVVTGVGVGAFALWSASRREGGRHAGQHDLSPRVAPAGHHRGVPGADS